jgi:preprotein translocase subunit YajC
VNDLIVAGFVGIIFFVLLYFVLIKPQADALKAHKRFVASIKVGDQVITAGGMVGIVKDRPNKEYVTLEITQGVLVKIKSDLIYEPYVE